MSYLSVAYDTVAGVDEAGRGPLAGPVYAAAVILNPHYEITGLTDSKKISERKRERLCVTITEQAHAFAIGIASVAEIEKYNIANASLLAMSRAIDGLQVKPKKILVDGKFCPKCDIPCEAIIKGDLLIPEISAASILAKVHRDRAMLKLHKKYPQYGFDKHKGYPTKAHIQAVKKYGVIERVYRRTFAPISSLIVS